MKIGTIAGGVGVTTLISLTYLPSVLQWDGVEIPTNLKVTVLGDGVICDLDKDGIQAATRMLRVGNRINGYFVPMSDGIVTGKNVEIAVTNNGADPIDLYGYSTQKGSTYIRSLQQKVFASSGVQLSDFFQCALPNMLETDELNITYTGGFVQKFAPSDLRMDVSFDTFVGGDSFDFRVQNTDARVKLLSFIPTVDEQVYIFKYSPVGNQ